MLHENQGTNDIDTHWGNHGASDLNNEYCVIQNNWIKLYLIGNHRCQSDDTQWGIKTKKADSCHGDEGCSDAEWERKDHIDWILLNSIDTPLLLAKQGSSIVLFKWNMANQIKLL